MRRCKVLQLIGHDRHCYSGLGWNAIIGLVVHDRHELGHAPDAERDNDPKFAEATTHQVR
jgi:hypothetical protein